VSTFLAVRIPEQQKEPEFYVARGENDLEAEVLLSLDLLDVTVHPGDACVGSTVATRIHWSRLR